jgi:hypothetical protein
MQNASRVTSEFFIEKRCHGAYFPPKTSTAGVVNLLYEFSFVGGHDWSMTVCQFCGVC